MDKSKPDRAPSHMAYSVRETHDGSSFYSRVGSAFPHKDGQGYSIVLDAVPVDGRIMLRTPKERIEEMKGERARPRERSRDQERDGR